MAINSVQARLFTILEPGKGSDTTSKICDYIIMCVTLAAVCCAVLETLPALLSSRPLFDQIEIGFTIFFTAELLVRLWVAPVGVPTLAPVRARIRYLSSFYGLVDILTVLPALLTFLVPGIDLSVLRIIRTLRILKISHYNTALTDLFSAVYHERKAFFSSAYLLTIALTLSSSLIFFAEHEMQPDKFSSIPAAMWWSIITLTTVGYGDVSPVTPLGQVIGAITALMGICTLALLTGIVTNSFSAQLGKKKQLFEMAVREALSDGSISEVERLHLYVLADEFNIAREHATSILDQLSKVARTP